MAIGAGWPADEVVYGLSGDDRVEVDWVVKDEVRVSGKD